METLFIPSFKAPARGTVTVPGSKSINNRALLLAALAQGQSLLTGALDSDEGAPGPIYLQGDHTSVEYRNIRITPAKAP